MAGARTLLWAVVFTSGLLSALLVNDTVCLMMTPLVLALVDAAVLPPLPYLLALAFGANAGSVATLTGNPQNMIVGTLSGISYARFTAALALPALASLLIVATVLHLLFRRDLSPGKLPPRAPANSRVNRPLLVRALIATALTIAGFLAGYSLAWTAVFAAALLMALAGRAPREAILKVDWPLLVFFAGLFVVVAGVARTGAATRMYELLAPAFGQAPARQAILFASRDFALGARAGPGQVRTRPPSVHCA